MMEKKMETTIMGSYRVQGLDFRAQVTIVISFWGVSIYIYTWIIQG